MTITTDEGRKEVLAYSIKGLAEAMSLSDQTIRDAIRASQLVAKRVGTRLIITPEDAKRWRDSLPDA